MQTKFEPEHKSFSDKCHLIAQEKFYPYLFKTKRNNLKFRDTSLQLGLKEQILDGEMAVDRIVKVSVEKLKESIEFTIQERFRGLEYIKYQDITITEWNNNSNLPSELYKLNAGIFIYGYANDRSNPTDLIQVIAIDTMKLLYLIANKSIKFNRNLNNKNQSFICIKINDLRESGSILAEYSNNIEF